jgi:hypothetical protein
VASPGVPCRTYSGTVGYDLSMGHCAKIVPRAPKLSICPVRGFLENECRIEPVIPVLHRLLTHMTVCSATLALFSVRDGIDRPTMRAAEVVTRDNFPEPRHAISSFNPGRIYAVYCLRGETVFPKASWGQAATTEAPRAVEGTGSRSLLIERRTF